MRTVIEAMKRSAWKKKQILELLGISSSRYFAWLRQEEAGQGLCDKKSPGRIQDRALPDEIQAVVEFALTHPADGYRRLAYQMIDEDVAFFSPSTVYRILDQHDLLYRWKRSESNGEGRLWEITRPDQQWHTDLMYLWVNGRWYFFIGVLDSYSRYIVHWDLLLSMQADNVALVIQEALEKTPGAKPHIVTDHGGQFTGKDFRTLVKEHDLVHIKTALAHPESNGRVERFHGSLRREGLREAQPEDYYQARDILGKYVEDYNNRRLHSALNYLRPVDYYRGNPDQLLEVRKAKLKAAREKRRERNLNLEKIPA